MKAHLLIGLIALLVLASGCVSEPVTKYVCSDGKTTVTDITSCPALDTTTPELTMEEALSVCSGMPLTQTYSFEDICTVGVAGKYKDTSPCRKLGRDQRTPCYAVVAELKVDPSICLEAEPQVDQCYAQYAADKKDGSICGKITDISYKDSCYSNLASQLSDPDLCDKIRVVNQKDSCYFNIAMRLGDSSYCDKIVNSSQKESCQQNIQNKGGMGIQIPSMK